MNNKIYINELYEKITKENTYIGIAVESGYIIIDSIITSVDLERDYLCLYYRDKELIIDDEEHSIVEVSEPIIIDYEKKYLWCYDIENYEGDVIASIYSYIEK